MIEEKKDITQELQEKLAEFNDKLKTAENPDKETKAVKIKIESLIRKHLIRFRKAADQKDLDHSKMFAFLTLVDKELPCEPYFKTNGFEDFNKYFA